MAADPACAPGAFGDPASFEVAAAGHRFAVHPGGAERLQALLGLIDGARFSLRMALSMGPDQPWGTGLIGYMRVGYSSGGMHSMSRLAFL